MMAAVLPENQSHLRALLGVDKAHTHSIVRRGVWPGLFCHHCRRADEVLNSSAPKLPNLGFSPVPTFLRTAAQGHVYAFGGRRPGDGSRCGKATFAEARGSDEVAPKALLDP